MSQSQTLSKGYLAVFGAPPPLGMPSWQIAERIVEVLDNPEWIERSLARECVFEISNGYIEWPSDEKRISVVLMAEDAAKKLFGFIHADVHMDDIAYAFLNG